MYFMYRYCILFLFLCHSYAQVVVTSEESLKILLEKIPQCRINGELLKCLIATHQNLRAFETIANKRKIIIFKTMDFSIIFFCF